MRLTFGYVLLGLSALSSLPGGSSRAVPNRSLSALDFPRHHAINRVPRAVIRVGAGPKVGGGSKPGDKPGGGGSPPPGADKDPNSAPARIGTETPENNKPSGSKDPAHIGDPNLFCRGTGCGGGLDEQPKAPTLSSEQKRTFNDRGANGIALVASPKKNEDFAQRMTDNYKFKKDEFEESVEDTIPAMGLDKEYGFKISEESWQSWKVNSKDNKNEPIVHMSFSKSKAEDGKEYLAFVAHGRYADRDGNRYQLDDKFNPLKDDKGDLLEKPDKDQKAAPIYQLAHEAAQQSGSLNKPVDKVFLISENVANTESQMAITEALAALGGAGGSKFLSKDATGLEADWFKLLAGTDNNNSYLRTAGRNPDFFRDYDLVGIKIWDGPEYKMNMELARKAT